MTRYLAARLLTNPKNDWIVFSMIVILKWPYYTLRRLGRYVFADYKFVKKRLTTVWFIVNANR